MLFLSKKIVFLAFLAIFLPFLAFAGNSNAVFVGDDAAITAGAINAVVRSSEAIWYNPAGLGGNTYSRLNLSGTVFALHLQNIPNAMQTTLPSGQVNQSLSANEYLIIPAAMTFVRQLNDDISYGFGVYVPQYGDISFNNSYSSVENFPTIAEPVNYAQGFNLDSLSTDYQLGFGMGWQATEKVRLGAAIFGIYDKFRFNWSEYESISSADGSQTTEIFFLDTYRSLISSLGIRATGGIQVELNKNWRFGANIFTPTFQLASWGNVVTSVGSVSQTGSVSSIRIDQNIKEWDGLMINPFHAQMSIAYQDEDFWIGLSGDIYTPLKTPNLLVDKKLNWNVCAGGKAILTPKISLGGGFFTDNSDSRTPTSFGEGRVNYYGVTFGADFKTPIARHNDPNSQPIIFGTVLAGRYALGLGEVGGQAFDPTRDENISNARTTLTDVVFHELSLYIGTSLYF